MRWLSLSLALLVALLTIGVMSSGDASADTFSYDDVTMVLTVLSDVGDIAESDVRDWDAVIGDAREIIVSDGVRTLGDNSFRGCVSVIRITLPSSLEHLGERAFAGCTHLTELNIRSVSPTADVGAFEFAGTSGHGVKVTYMDGANVANRLFWGMEKVASVDLGNVTVISDRAFYDIGPATFGPMTGITHIGDLALYGCTGIREVEFGRGLEHLGSDAFYECVSLGSVIFGARHCDDLTGNGAFRGTSEGMRFLMTSTCTYVPGYLFKGTSVSELTIGENVVTIGDHAFDGYDGAEVVLPVGLTSIGEASFLNCTALRTLTLTGIMTKVGKGAFDGCVNLRSVTFSSDMDGLTPDTVFFRYTGAKDVAVRVEGVAHVPDHLFLGFSGISSLVLDDSVTHIGDSAFAFCTGIGTLDLSNVEHIGRNAFLSCDTLRQVTFHPSEVTIGDLAFAGCDVVTIELPGVTLGSDVFNGNGLASVDFKGRVVCVEGSLSGIGSPTIKFMSSDLTLPAGTFSGNGHMVLEFICHTVPSDILASFDGGFSLRISSPTIGDRAFKDCTGLTTVTFTDVTSIGKESFRGCTSVTELSIPSSITGIGGHAFSDMVSLNALTYRANVPGFDLGSMPFSGSGSDTGVTVYIYGDVPDNMFEGTPPPALRDVVFVDTVSIGDGSFRGTPLSEVTFPDTLTHIGRHAFSDSALIRVTIPKGVMISQSAFSGCRSLTSADLRSMTTIPDSMFDGCSSLSGLTVSHGLRTIGERAFFGTALRTLQLPCSMTEVGKDAFRQCPYLEHVTILAHGVRLDDGAFRECPVSVAEMQEGTVLGKDVFSPCVNSRILLTGCPRGTIVADRQAYSGQGQGGDVIVYDLGALGHPSLSLFHDTVVDPDLLPSEGKEFIGWVLEDGTPYDPSTYSGEIVVYGTWKDAEHTVPERPLVDPELLNVMSYILILTAMLCTILANIRKRSS